MLSKLRSLKSIGSGGIPGIPYILLYIHTFICREC